MSKVVITAALSGPATKKDGVPHCLKHRRNSPMKLESAMSWGGYCSCYRGRTSARGNLHQLRGKSYRGIPGFEVGISCKISSENRK